MDILIAAVGRWGRRHAAERSLYEFYAGRLQPPPLLREVEERRPLPAADRQAREAALLLEAAAPATVRVVLDAGGRLLDSEAFARQVAGWRDSGHRSVGFLIGGADGHGEAVLRSATLTLSFGPMTWPHLLVRGMLAEQLYRAQQILAGHPYHRA